MTLKGFYDAIENLNIDFGELPFEYCDSSSSNSFSTFMDDESYETLVFDCFEDHSDEVDYDSCYIGSDNVYIYLDMDSVVAVVNKYYSDQIEFYNDSDEDEDEYEDEDEDEDY